MRRREIELGTPTPASIKARLDTEVAGQDEAKERLAVIAWRHAMQFQAPRVALEYAPRNLLLLGPPGSGKTALVAATARVLGLPYACVSAPMFVGSGFAGLNFAEILAELYEDAGEKKAIVQRGILQVDHLDQIRILSNDSDTTTTKMTQHNLIRFLRRGSTNMDGEVINTARLLIVLTGSFEDCERFIRTPAKEVFLSDSIEGFPKGGFPEGDKGGFPEGDKGGFPESETLSYATVMDAMRRAGQTQAYRRRICIEAEDLIHWGYLPEMLRDVDIIALRDLDTVDLMTILEGERSPIHNFRDLFALWGVELTVTHAARYALAQSAFQKGGSAAALDGLLERLLHPSFLEVHQLRERGITHVVVTLEAFRSGTVVNVQGNPVWPAVEPTQWRVRSEAPEIARLNAISDKAKLKAIKRLKNERFGWASATPPAKAWWDEWESRNQNRPDVILHLIENLTNRGVTLDKFFSAHAEARTEKIEALLHYLDYLKARAPNST